MTYTLRDYQQAAVDRIKWSLDLPGNDIVCIAQGGGKSLIIAEAARQIGKVLICCHSQEIIKQNIHKLSTIVDKEDVGVYSASLNSKDIKKITLGTIQSIYKQAYLFKEFDVVIIDECHLVNPERTGGMYGTLFKNAAIKKIIGFTGTPFRLDSYYKRYGPHDWQVDTITTIKMINRYKKRLWHRLLTVVNTADLVRWGYLVDIDYISRDLFTHSQIAVNKSKSDFDLDAFTEQSLKIAPEIVRGLAGLKHDSVLVFCASVAQAEALSGMIPDSAVVSAQTKTRERSRLIEDFKAGKIRYMFNVNVFTTGFDFPGLEALVLLRPTRSLTLHCQMLGRVARIDGKKSQGVVYDLVGNVKSLGTLKGIEIKKDKKGMWNVLSPQFPDGFHYHPLYKFDLASKKRSL